MKALLNHWENVVNPARNELVFQNRNKSYGAFVIRKEYSKDVLLSLTFSLGLFISLVGIGVIHYWTSKPCDGTIQKIVEIINLTPISVDPVKPTVTVPVDIPKSVQIETRRFVNPIVTTDETITDDPIPPSDYKGAISTVNSVGVPLAGNLPPEIVVGTSLTRTIDTTINEGYKINQQPEYPGGIEEFYKDVNARLRYPEEAQQHGIEGNVFVQFVIETDGTMSNIKAFRNEYGLGIAAERALAKLKKWKPGKNDGNPVRVRFSLPIKFIVNN